MTVKEATASAMRKAESAAEELRVALTKDSILRGERKRYAVQVHFKVVVSKENESD